MCFGVVCSKVLFRNYLAPFGVLSIVWGASFLWLSVMTFHIAPFHTLTWLAISLAWFSAMLGSVFAVIVFQIASSNKRHKYNFDLFVRYKKWIIILGILAIIGSIRFFIVVTGYFGVKEFFAKPLHARTMLTTEYSTGKLTLIFWGVTFAAAVLSGIWLGRKTRSYLLYVPLLAGAVSSIMFVGRSHIFNVVILFTVAFLLSQKGGIRLRLKSTVKRNIAILLIALIFFAGPTMFISQYRSKSLEDTWIPQVVLRFLDFSQHWYLLDEVLQYPSPMNMGVNIFPAFIRSFYYMGLRGDDGRHLGSGNVSIKMPLGSESNKYTLVADLYLDFGFWGIFFYLFFFVFFSGFFFCLYKKHDSLVALSILPFFYQGIFVSLGGSNFDYASVFGMLISVVVAALIEKRWRQRCAKGPVVIKE